jgi:hypothetical protein
MTDSRPGDAMPAAWWRLPADLTVLVRHRTGDLPHLSRLAFADEFAPSRAVDGHAYVDLSPLTRWLLYLPASVRYRRRRACYVDLATAFPEAFHTVISVHRPRAVWLALRLSRLDDPIADTLLTHHQHLRDQP